MSGDIARHAKSENNHKQSHQKEQGLASSKQRWQSCSVECCSWSRNTKMVKRGVRWGIEAKNQQNKKKMMMMTMMIVGMPLLTRAHLVLLDRK